MTGSRRRTSEAGSTIDGAIEGDLVRRIAHEPTETILEVLDRYFFPPITAAVASASVAIAESLGQAEAARSCFGTARLEYRAHVPAGCAQHEEPGK